MRIGIISGVIGLFVTLPVHAQKSDSIKSMLLPDVVVTESYQQRQAKKSALTVEVIEQDFLRNTIFLAEYTHEYIRLTKVLPPYYNMCSVYIASSLKCYHFRTCEGGKPPFNPP